VSIMPIETVSASTAVAGLQDARNVTGPSDSGGDFASALASGLENVQALQSKTDGLAVQAATGDLKDVHDYMIASTESGIATQLTVAVRNKAVEAFSEIMRMTV
jgi:flagellar hook-basal body complex protein FliE